MSEVLSSASHRTTVENTDRERVASFSVAVHGAYLLDFVSADGSNLIFPAQLTDRGKLRGGLFVTLPQFGPDFRESAEQLDQHGFARDVMWRLASGGPGAFKFRYTRETGEYAGLSSTVKYMAHAETDESMSLEAELFVENGSDTNLRTAPGLHPYFAVDEEDLTDFLQTHDIEPDGSTFEAVNHGVQFASGHSIEVVSGSGFEQMTIWNGGDGNYLCIEPSVAGPSFKTHPSEPLDAEILQAGDSRVYSAKFLIAKSA